MTQYLKLIVIGMGNVRLDVSSDYPKRIEDLVFTPNVLTLKISKADYQKYMAIANIAGTQAGLGHYIRATENVNRWYTESIFKSSKTKGNNSGYDLSSTADATFKYFMDHQTGWISSTASGSPSFYPPIISPTKRIEPININTLSWAVP